ncbi:PorT family protein [Hymenobacter busanensis]|uniref:PorT family protein n=1 Tax=Hymenobacter busanensis TaxID=2607656 RepID=A0A7L4ZZQ7_9BACT|nr:porin family protein [Hymenobacter busanensis]KAA9331610.1 PorT family protein [Hymenobacter busanensis]QHJ08761.1 outer membrane beta-barrel protein [Hymenobacter busanensis]
MKKLSALALTLLVGSAAYAQDPGGFRLGLKAGATYSNISGDNVEQIAGSGYETSLGKYKIGYNVGVAATLPISSDGFFAIQPEILYNRKGYQIETDSKSTNTNLGTGVSKVEQEQERVLHYIDVPVLARINAGGLFFELGPQFSYLFGSKVKSQTTTKYSNGTKDKVEDNGGFLDYTGVSRDDAYKSDLSQFDLSGVAGLGYQTDAGLSINLRYARGFNSLLDTKDADNEPKAFNNAYTLQIGYLLPVGK